LSCFIVSERMCSLMNILPVSLKFNSENRSQKVQSSYATRGFGLKMAAPIQQDMVTFGAVTAKKFIAAEAVKNGASYATAQKAHKAAAEIQTELTNFFKEIFKDVNVTIHGRAKTADSIWLKSGVRGWDTINKIFQNMTDLNGIKIVMNESQNYAKLTSDVVKILNKYIDMNLLILGEIENKRPGITSTFKKAKDKAQYDYIPYEVLDDMAIKACLKSGKPVNFEPVDLTGANYSAVHFLFRLPGQKRFFECQFMGPAKEMVKNFDDKIFKELDNKGTDEFIKTRLAPLKDENDPNSVKLRKLFDKYRADCFLAAREKELKQNKDGYLGVRVPPELAELRLDYKTFMEDYAASKKH